MDPYRAWQVVPAVALPRVVYIKVVGTIEYLGENGEVIESANAQTQRAVYLAWCREHGVPPDAQILG